MMTEDKKVGRAGVGHGLRVIACASAVVAACGGEPKKEPSTVTAPATASAPPPALSTAPVASTASPVASDTGTAPPAPSKKQAECDALVDDANSTLDAERISVDKQCKNDTDCVLIRGRACAFFCTTGSVPKSEEKGWNATVQKVKDQQCKKWNDNECSKLRTKPPPTCQDRAAWCDKGHCALKEK